MREKKHIKEIRSSLRKIVEIVKIRKSLYPSEEIDDYLFIDKLMGMDDEGLDKVLYEYKVKLNSS